MNTCIAAIAFVALIPQVASAKKRFIKGAPPPMHQPARQTLPRTNPKIAPTVAPLSIPAGQFGLTLDDGTRIVGVPSKRWSAILKTRVGQVTVPRDEVSTMEFIDGRIRIQLQNGDHISGQLVSRTMIFETRFGQLRFPVNSMIRLRASQATPSRQVAATIESLLPQLKGKWIVTYTNKTQQVRRIRENRIVNGGDELVENNGDLLIVFSSVIERITFSNGKLFVEHFNPGSTYPNGIPAVMGVGRKAAERLLRR